jgi:hypothetical protein
MRFILNTFTPHLSVGFFLELFGHRVNCHKEDSPTRVLSSLSQGHSVTSYGAKLKFMINKIRELEIENMFLSFWNKGRMHSFKPVISIANTK